MKKLLLTLLIGCSSFYLHAGKNQISGWFHFTPLFGAGTSWMGEGAMLNDDSLTPDVFNFSYMFGAQLGCAFVNTYDVSFEVNYNVAGQGFSVAMNTIDYKKKYTASYIDYALLFKYMSSRGFFEIGASMSNMLDMSVANNVTRNTFPDEPLFMDNTEHFKKQYYNLIAGFGTHVAQSGLMEISIGVRGKYGLKPLTNGTTSMINDNIFRGESDYTNAHNFSLLLEVNIHGFFGFFGKAICGKRRMMFFQQPRSLLIDKYDKRSYKGR